VRLAVLLLTAVLLLVRPVRAGELVVPPPGAQDTCPVCGMFVAKYPDWVATVVYRDGHAHHFDGAKDLFKYLQDLPRYAPGHAADDRVAIAVTDYYALGRIDARTAFYVVGSDVLGPMGHELIPLETRSEAEEFLKDHKGERILLFEAVTPEVIQSLDRQRGR